jgi:DNA invertase Pin-like site-specific DNA recombinase
MQAKKNKLRKLTSKQVQAIRKAFWHTETRYMRSAKQLAEQYHVTVQTIYNVVNEKYYSEVA